MPAVRFPAIELVPKRETQLLDFLASNETSDGRGIVIAVLDQGKINSKKYIKCLGTQKTNLDFTTRPLSHGP